MTVLPVLYTFRRCPYAMRARMALLLGQKAVRVREILLRQKPDEMLAASPKGTVPVLVLPEGLVLDESREIMDWALADVPETTIHPQEDERTDATAMIALNDGPFKHHLDRYKYAARYEDVEAATHQQAGAAILAGWDGKLAGGWLLRGRPTTADIAIMPFVRQFRIADADWFDRQPWPHLHRWLSRLMASPVFCAAMAKFEHWRPGEPEPALEMLPTAAPFGKDGQ